MAATVQAFNGTLDTGPTGDPIPPKPAILIYAETDDGLKAYLPTLFRSKDALETAEGTPPAAGTQSLFSLTSLRLVIPAKTKRVGGRIVALAETPRSCPRGRWRFVQTNSYYSGENLVAKDSQPCVR